jgi:hypothetical protein
MSYLNRYKSSSHDTLISSRTTNPTTYVGVVIGSIFYTKDEIRLKLGSIFIYFEVKLCKSSNLQ